MSLIRKSRDWSGWVGFTWEDAEDGNLYEFLVCGTIEAYTPASMYGGPDHVGSSRDHRVIPAERSRSSVETEASPVAYSRVR